MATAQHGIFTLGARCHRYLELDLRPGASAEEVARAVAGLREPSTTTGGANLVVGFAPELWAELAPQAAPEGVTSFEGLRGPDGFTMPSTQHDLWLWISAAGDDVIFDMARGIHAALSPWAEITGERGGFTYRDSRDLTGFIDGTENPTLGEAAAVVAVPDDAAGAGSSVALVQVWVHDLDAFEALPVAAQEAVFGRTKADSVELGDDEKPASAHIARVVIEEDGEELEVFRRSTSFGNLGEHGLVFVAFSAEQRRLAMMLDRMVGAADGVRDELTRYSTPITGAYYVVPSIEALNDLARGS